MKITRLRLTRAPGLSHVDENGPSPSLVEVVMASASDCIHQAAAIPVWGGQVGLVTSSSGNRWVVPKGHLEPDKTAGQVALQEAWEEAGLVGVLRPEPVGSYLYGKFNNVYHVIVFVMDVTEAAADWPERSVRERVWVEPAEAVARIQEKGLRELIRAATAERALSET
jgi:8-oxo-dGTP pyrophosphatase MutT (NUDIX family)